MDNIFADLIPQQNVFADLIPQQPSTAMDVTKSIGSNLAQGALGVPMIIPNLMNGIATGPQELYRGIRDTFQGNPTDNSPMWKPFFDSGDVSQATGIAYQPKTVAGAVAAIPAQIGGAMAGGVLASNPEIMTNTAKGAYNMLAGPKSVNVPENIKSTLLAENPDVMTYSGDELGQHLQGAEQNAFTNKELAYQQANKAGGESTVTPGIASYVADSIDKSLAKLDPEQVTSVDSIKKYTGELRDLANGDNVSGVKYNMLENLRQRINNIPYKAETSAGIKSARNAFDSSMDDILNLGLIKGNPDALDLIKNARTENAYWRQKFSGDQANAAISKYIDSVGGPEQIAPENLLNIFTKVGQAGLNNVKAAQDVLGNSATPLLQNGYLNTLRMKSVDSSGNINPGKLSTNINTLINKNPTLLQSVFKPEEITALQAISKQANLYATGAKGNPGMLSKISSKIPILGDLISDTIASRENAQMMKTLNNPPRSK